jgi:hypothetical protein
VTERKNRKPSGLYINHCLLSSSLYLPCVFLLSILLYIWIIFCFYLQSSLGRHHRARSIAYSTLHFTFSSTSHIPHCTPHHVLHITLQSVFRYRLHCTSHSTENTPCCISHSTLKSHIICLILCSVFHFRLHSTSHYILHYTLHSTSNKPCCIIYYIPHFKLHAANHIPCRSS